MYEDRYDSMGDLKRQLRSLGDTIYEEEDTYDSLGDWNK